MKADLLIQRIEENRYDNLFKDIYVDESLVETQKQRYIKAINKFQEIFGSGQDVLVYSVPGRSEIGGNHTDHQHGKVLACALNLDIIGVVSPTKSEYININSDGRRISGIKTSDLSLQKEDVHSSRGLVKGVLKKVDDDFYRLGGFNGYFTSDVLVGSGMSSSAAFEVLVGTIASGLYNRFEIDPVTIAKYSQYAENVYFGKPSGLMDQMACSVGNLISIDFANIRKPLIKKIDVDFSASGYSLCIVDAKGSHASLTGDYAAIPQELKLVAEYFGKEYVSELTYEQVMGNIADLRVKTNDRAVLRAIHVILENQRVDKEVEYLQKGDITSFLQVVKESGDSSYRFLQNVYSPNDPTNQSLSVALMASEQILKDKGVCRVHGGGFAGTIQAFVQNDFVDEYKNQIEKVFGENTCKVLKIRKYGGIEVFK